MTQLSIAKPGIVEVFLFNLRESVRQMMFYRDMDPRLGTIRSLYSTQDPQWYKYNMLAPTDPMFKYADMDLYFHRKQMVQDQARLNLVKSASIKGGRKKASTSKSPALGYSLNMAGGTTLPPLITDRGTANVSKLDLEEKQQEVLAKEEEVQTLRAKLKRLEHLLSLKDARIQDLQTQVDKLKPGKRYIGATQRDKEGQHSNTNSNASNNNSYKNLNDIDKNNKTAATVQV